MNIRRWWWASLCARTYTHIGHAAIAHKMSMHCRKVRKILPLDHSGNVSTNTHVHTIFNYFQIKRSVRYFGMIAFYWINVDQRWHDDIQFPDCNFFLNIFCSFFFFVVMEWNVINDLSHDACSTYLYWDIFILHFFGSIWYFYFLLVPITRYLLFVSAWNEIYACS